jgi:hypothetical protein
MAEIQRSSTVVWERTIARGTGLLSAHGGAFTALPVTIASRFREPEGAAAGRRLVESVGARSLAVLPEGCLEWRPRTANQTGTLRRFGS